MPAEVRAGGRTGYNRYRNQRTFAEVRTTEEIARTVRCATKDARLNHSVTNAAPLELPAGRPAVPPYALGVWLGDGTSAGSVHQRRPGDRRLHRGRGSGRRADRRGRRYSLRLPARGGVAARPCPMCGELFVPQTSQVQTCGRLRWRAASQRRRRPPGDVPRLRRSLGGHGAVPGLPRRPRHGEGAPAGLGVLGDKHIPAAYLRGSVTQRRALLAGLLDTDGTVAPNGVVQFGVTSRRLAEDARELIASLGYRVG